MRASLSDQSDSSGAVRRSDQNGSRSRSRYKLVVAVM